MPTAKSGKKYNSKFRASRADREAAKGMEKTTEPKGERAQANEIEAKGQGDAYQQEEQLEEQIHPGIHDEVANLAAEHGPATDVHITHDHANGQHHVTSTHGDGYTHTSVHGTPDEAHIAGAAAGGVNPEGNYPEGHEAPTTAPNPKHKAKPSKPQAEEEDDSYTPEPLD